VDGSCHAKILSRRARIFGLEVRMQFFEELRNGNFPQEWGDIMS